MLVPVPCSGGCSACFVPMHDSNRSSCYWHDGLKLNLVVYVDGFKMSGPAKNLTEGLVIFGEEGAGLLLEQPQPGALYFWGCIHRRHAVRLPTGKMANAIEYDMASYLRSTVGRYCDLAKS